MVDVDLLHGTYLIQLGDDSLQAGIGALQRVTREATPMNRARAYHQLAQSYLRNQQCGLAETMLDSMYALLGSSTYIALDYAPIINHYLEAKNHNKVDQYVRLMMQERQALKTQRLSYDLIETIAQLESEQKRQQQKIEQLRQVNQRLWLLVGIVLLIVVLSGVVIYLIYQKRQHVHQMRQAEERLFDLKQKLQQSHADKEMRAQELKEFLNTKDNRQELETLTPTLLQTDGESKFRQYFELLYPLFLPRLREKVPSVTPREELLSMLVVLKQDNKRIAELLAIAPRSVLMLRHRFRQKIGIDTELSLESFIEGLLADKSI
jgi:DNA-binding CsgD family transcriptional regulator